MTVTSSQQYPNDDNYQVNHTRRSGAKIVAGYELEQKLGSGSFATVYKGKKVDSVEDIVAIKSISRSSSKLTKKVLANLELEIQILRTYRHPNIVFLHQVHKTERHFYLILEYCAGGDLQRLIHSRKAGRLTERLTRRIIRDLTAGMEYLWNQELIHRDIKPQNLLLTGPLPLDEINDPSKSETEEEARFKSNFPTYCFHLKIADFGFARHLQSKSLAETLCGSPLYMAPEILQHRSYDAKADLWSAGAVLFEMITGRPPFDGENHIDLLRNIETKSVRLPVDVKISTECVKLLRLLLNRNPQKRGGFREFCNASEDFVKIGCNGRAVVFDNSKKDDNMLSRQHSLVANNLGPISEGEESTGYGEGGIATGATQAMNRETECIQTAPQQQEQHCITIQEPAVQNHKNMVYVSNLCTDYDKKIKLNRELNDTRVLNRMSPSLGPVQVSEQHPALSPNSKKTSIEDNREQQKLISSNCTYYSHVTPLEPSPPGPLLQPSDEGSYPPPLNLGNECVSGSHQIQEQSQYDDRLLQHYSHSSLKTPANLQISDENGFVMVEHGGIKNPYNCSPGKPIKEENTYHSPSINFSTQTLTRRQVVLASSPPVSTETNNIFSNTSTFSSRKCIHSGADISSKGMLGTSPGTGGAFLRMMKSPPHYKQMEGRGLDCQLIDTNGSGQPNIDLSSKIKMLATAEDVGRRAVHVAHLGDTKTYLAMRLIMMNDTDSLLLSPVPMECVEEEKYNYDGQNISGEEQDDNEMPFAIDTKEHKSNISITPMISEIDVLNEERQKSSKKSSKRVLLVSIQNHFREALLCYIKSLSMLKSSVNATQCVQQSLHSLQQSLLHIQSEKSVRILKERCTGSQSWLSKQFKGVLERADAAHVEIGKIQESYSNGTELYHQINQNDNSVVSVEELIYIHFLACGRDGAVKQLLGQYDTARSCYRSAGLLAETLLMEPKLCVEDRKILEDYVQGFSDRITEVDSINLRQSKKSLFYGESGIVVNGNIVRGADVIDLVGNISQKN